MFFFRGATIADMGERKDRQTKMVKKPYRPQFGIRRNITPASDLYGGGFRIVWAGGVRVPSASNKNHQILKGSLKENCNKISQKISKFHKIFKLFL